MDGCIRRSVVRAEHGRAASHAVADAGATAVTVPVDVDGSRLPASVAWVVDDCPTARAAQTRTLEAAGIVVSWCASASAFLERYDPDQPGCVLAAIEAPLVHGLDLLARLGGADAPLPVVLTTRHPQFETAVQAFRAGAADVLVTPFGLETARVRLQPLIDRDRARRTARAGRAAILARLALLTARERMVLDGLLEGCTSKEIACGLAISTRTVESHRANLLEKLDAGSTGRALHMVLLATRGGGLRTP